MKRSRQGRGFTAWLATLVLAGGVAGVADAALVASFTNDFSSNPFLDANYSSAAAASVDFTHDSANERIIAKGTGGTGNFSLVTEVSNLGGTNKTPFVVESKGVNSNRQGNQISLFAMISGAHTDNVALSGYSANFNADGGVRIYKDGNTTPVVTTDWTGALTGDVDLSLEGLYSDLGALTLTFTVTDGTVTEAVTYVDATPSSGHYFGLGSRVLGASGGREIKFNEFSVTVIPEPATLGLVLFSGLGCLLFRHLMLK